jgi:hypothetical protein
MTQFTVESADGDTTEIESVSRDDWDGLNSPCPVCGGTEFHHTKYESGHYGHEGEAVILRKDYWDQRGPIRTKCRDCGEVLHKDAVYDLLESGFTTP